MRKYTVFTANGRSYVAVAKAYGNKDRAITIANQHFKTKRGNLTVTGGKIKNNLLFMDTDGAYWVVSRREKA